MFVRTENRRSLHSHHFSSRLRRFFAFFAIISVSHATAAQVKETKKPNLLGYTMPSPTASPSPSNFSSPSPNPSPSPVSTYNQFPRDKNSRIDTATFKRPKGEADWADFFRNLHGSYALSFMGPRVAGSGNETYNIFIPDVAPVQLSHYWQLGFQVSPDLQLGFKASAIQNVADNVAGKTGIIRGRTYEAYDPEIYANLPNFINVDGMFVFSSVTMSVPLTDYSKRNGKITQLSFNQNWSVANYPSKWSFGFHIQVQPTFFSDPMPSYSGYRKTLYLETGHVISYQISPIVTIQSTSVLDMDHRYTDNAPQFSEFNTGLDDTSRIAISINPSFNSSFYISMGGYFQFLLWKPSMETSILGLDLQIGF